MEIVVLEERENPFFKRQDLTLSLKHVKSATPTKQELVKQLAADHSVDESQVVVEYIFTKSGTSESIAKVKILQEKPKEVSKPEKKETVKTETKEEKTEKPSEVKKEEGEKVEAQTSQSQ